MGRSRGKPQSGLRERMPLGDFLAAYLWRAGVRHIFGLPGDLVLGLFHHFGATRGLEIITFSHEPAVGFAADGYARSTRRLGVVCVTYGAGGHNIVNPIAGAYAEQVPLLVVSGGPGEAEQKLAGVHHQVKDVEAQSRIFAEVTCASRILAIPERAADEAHEVVSTIAAEHRPGYLEIHRDMVEAPIRVPPHIVDWDGSFPKPVSDPRKLDEAVGETIARLERARSVVLIGGVELFRESAEEEFLRLAEELRVPVVTTVLAKGVFPMDHPLHMGIHAGPLGAPAIQERVREADLVLALGTQLTDMNLGASKPQVRRERSIWAVSNRVNVSFHQYTDVALKDFVSALAERELPCFRGKVTYYDNLEREGFAARRREASELSVNDLLLCVNEFLDQYPGYHVFAESGDMLFGGLEVRLQANGLYFAQGYYASMGFAIPAAMGAQIGTGVRPLVLCGDGGFQMTGPEISFAPGRGLSPIVVIVNNGGWGIFRPVSPRHDLLRIPAWPYAELARAWGGVGFDAHSPSELREALRAAHETSGFAIIDCRVPHSAHSPMAERYIRQSASRSEPS